MSPKERLGVRLGGYARHPCTTTRLLPTVVRPDDGVVGAHHVPPGS